MAYFTFDNKKVFYEEIGQGAPILLLPGNSGSSKMFDSLLADFSKNFKLILIDFPGHGKSERVAKFETDFWFYNSAACNALLDVLNLEQVMVIGTSGGAITGINLALEHPEKVSFLIADSFMGEYPLDTFNHSLRAEREQAKTNEFAQAFWLFNHGDDWEQVVDLDTEMLLTFGASGHSFFHKPISELMVPTLLTGSLEDDIVPAIDTIYADLKKKNMALDIHLFDTGNHPAMLSNGEAFYGLVNEKLKRTLIK